jgi:hypothetical protein
VRSRVSASHATRLHAIGRTESCGFSVTNGIGSALWADTEWFLAGKRNRGTATVGGTSADEFDTRTHVMRWNWRDFTGDHQVHRFAIDLKGWNYSSQCTSFGRRRISGVPPSDRRSCAAVYERLWKADRAVIVLRFPSLNKDLTRSDRRLWSGSVAAVLAPPSSTPTMTVSAVWTCCR